MAGFLSNIGDKLGMRGGGSGDDKMQYLLAGTLVLVIVISLVATFSGLFGSKKGANTPTEQHYWDVELDEEFVLTPEQLREQMTKGEGPGMGMPGIGGMRVINPKTGKRTGVAMMRCPKCEKYFLPESWKDADSEMGMGMAMPGDMVCTHCDTDINEYYREQRKKRRKK